MKYKSSPSVDQKISVSLSNKNSTLSDNDRIKTVNLSQVFDEERQNSSIFRPTFKVKQLYSNNYVGITNYPPFRDTLYYYNPVNSVGNNSWSGYPQFYEFDFYRPDTNDGHIQYQAISAYTYNWTYYISYSFRNEYLEVLKTQLNNTIITWASQDGIPFKINNITSNGDKLISFECVCQHNLNVSESVELSISYNNKKIFEVYSLGNDKLGSEKFIFNVYNPGYTGTSFANNTIGTFKRVIDSENIKETKSKYYVRKHKILTNVDDLIVTKCGFERNPFLENKQMELSSLTSNKITRISKKNNTISYLISSKKDLDLYGMYDNQKRPISELFLTVINKGYSGYFNSPNLGVGTKQGWQFNISLKNNSWWDKNNNLSNSALQTLSYQISGITFYYNQDLKEGDELTGDFCEWNDYEQKEYVLSPYYHKITFNQNVFQTTATPTTNPDGYYYQPHHMMKIREFSNYIETGDLKNIDQVPTYSFFSEVNQEFRWRDLLTYGFVDETGLGVDYPYLNNSHYPYTESIFKIAPEGINTNSILTGSDKPYQPNIDGCE